MFGIEDSDLPGLADLSESRLRAMTGAEEVDLLRLRYRPGKRAILHVATRSGADRREGALWFFKGQKGQRLARRASGRVRFDPQTRALFEAFPRDHRMPQIGDFLARHDEVLADMTGARAAGEPVLLRYRPGLSCTFRCALDGRAPVYLKLVNDDDPRRLQAVNRAMRAALAGTDVTVAAETGIDLDLGAVAYISAPGLPLDAALATQPLRPAMGRALSALSALHAAPVLAERQLGPEVLLRRARESATFVAAVAPSCASGPLGIVDRLAVTVPGGTLRPIHGDMKLEHLFLDPERVTPIDTESLSLGPPDYDLAQLYGRLWQAELHGDLPTPVAREASAMVRDRAGASFDWCLGVVAVRLAKFYAQRPAPDTAQSITAILDRVR